MRSNDPLISIIEDELRQQGGRISFYRFMELCLYHPQYGYYNSPDFRLGKTGDFYTSAHTGPVFARILAGYLESRWREAGQQPRVEFLELGPGDGSLAAELLSWIGQRYPEFFEGLFYTAVEQSASLRSRLQDTLLPFGGHARVVAAWEEVGTVPAPAPSLIQRCVFANEFFDALPVHLLVWRDERWRERFVCLEGSRLSWCEADPGSPELIEDADTRFACGSKPSERDAGWVAEISPRAAEWMNTISQWLLGGSPQSELLVIDYGYTLEEWRQGRFPQGSAMAYRHHQALDDLLSLPGGQDLTVHVNFTSLIETGTKAGLQLRNFVSQSKFLTTIGENNQFQDAFLDCGSEAERFRRAHLLKTLILPQGMGEIFRVLVMSKSE